MPPRSRSAVFAIIAALSALATSAVAQSPRFTGPDGKLRVVLAQQPFVPNGTSPGPRRMATG